MVYILLFFSLQNAVCFIILTYLVPELFTFYIQSVLKLKKNNSGAKRLKNVHVSLLGKPGEFSKQPAFCQASANADGGSKASSVPANALLCVCNVSILSFFACTAGLCVCLSFSLNN